MGGGGRAGRASPPRLPPALPVLSPAVHVLTSLERDPIAELLAAERFFWLDLESPPDGDLVALGELLHLHPLALEDTREFGQRPKLDRYGDQVLLVFYSARTLDAPGRP